MPAVWNKTYPQMAVVGKFTPKCYIYLIEKEKSAFMTPQLSPFLTIDVPGAPERTEEEKEAMIAAAQDANEDIDDVEFRRQSIFQLEVVGSNASLWVVLLLWDRSIKIFRCSLGPPDESITMGATLGQPETIAEDHDAEMRAAMEKSELDIDPATAAEAAGAGGAGAPVEEKVIPTFETQPVLTVPLYNLAIEQFQLLKNPRA